MIEYDEYMLVPDLRKRAAMRGIAGLLDAISPQSENVYYDLAEPYDPKPPKFWPSTIKYIDQTCGGFYGMTVVAAQPGTGKTLLAIATAIEAAASGNWQVVIFAAEDDYDGFRDRFNRYLAAHPAAQDCLPNLHFHAVGKGQDPESLTSTVLHAVDREMDTPILLVLDSINSIVNLSGSNYLAGLSSIGLWAMLARRVSEGNVSFFITSETNKAGEAKGETLSFWADFYLKMKKKSDNVVEMELAKTRRTPGAGKMGKYLRNWTIGEFEAEGKDDTEPGYAGPLKLVGGNYYERD